VKGDPVDNGQSSRLFEDAQALGGLVRGEADAADSAGTLTAEVVRALAERRLFLTLTPREVGGLGRSLVETMDIIEEVSSHDGATGWALMVGISHNAMTGALLGESAALEIFGSGDAVTAGMLAPVGRAVIVDGGYEFEGRLKFGSGIQHATWVASGGIVRDADDNPVLGANGEPDHRVFVTPAAAARPEGDWRVLGLRGTGSLDYRVERVRVPAEFSFSVSQWSPRRGREVFRAGLKGLSAAGHMAVALGIARRALDEIGQLALHRARPDSPAVADQQLFKHDFVVHDAAIRAARALGWAQATAMEEHLERGGEMTPLLLHRMHQVCTYAHRVALEAGQFAYSWAGTAAMREPSVLGRGLRDLLSASQHIIVDPNTFVRAAPVLLEAASERY
jgi:alkylation response protein AidB-like acyl-CoA dehydrogenase